MQSISVIISSYNAEKTLSAALDALEMQDIGKEKFEVIIIDDGSTDWSKKLIEQYIAKNTFTLSYYYQANAGVGIARNHGIQKAQGDILAFTDADCMCDIDRLSVIEKSIREEKKQFVWWYTYSKDTIIFPRKMAPVNQRWVTANLALDRSAVPEDYILFNLWFTGMVGDDIDLVLSLEKKWIPLHYIPEMKVQHPANILTFERFLIRWKGRMNEVGLYKKHGKRTLDCFSPIYKPLIFWRVSLFTILVCISLIVARIIFQSYWLGWVLLIWILVFLLFLTYGYKALVIYQADNQPISIEERVKTLFYFLLSIPLFFRARVKGMIKFKFFML